jgi:hypothetical protein
VLDAYIIQKILEDKKRKEEEAAREQPRVYIEEPLPVRKPKEPERKEPIVFDL